MPQQAVWPIGFILGAVGASVVLSLFDVGGILRLILIVAGGVGVGFLSETVYKNKES